MNFPELLETALVTGSWVVETIPMVAGVEELTSALVVVAGAVEGVVAGAVVGVVAGAVAAVVAGAVTGAMVVV